ncbi:MAG: Beta-galactosidase BgaA [Verrucomicrobiae bacterium]|nr:Beta-galactosidase BgaA [Verrucomicrobiae bacterium]
MKTLSHRRPATLDRFWFGAAYYPEHWDAATREHDADRMAAAGFNMVRLGEFAWDRLEPLPGQFDFGLFDETIARLGDRGIRTMFCTPTAAPPVGLSRRHPEILRVNENGVTFEHGSRQHACHASPVFREHSRRITQALADHFRDNPHVVAWQTDNEFHCHFSECHCANCQTAFQDFLRQKYSGDIAALNAAWGTAFWALTYRDFAEIRTPKRDKPTFANPAAQLDYYRYLSAAVTEFQHDQIEILRAANPRWFVTHNGLFGHIDYRGKFTQDLDILGYDCYPMFATDVVWRPANHAFGVNYARAWSGNFIIPEQQSGPGGQAPYFQDHPEPGELRKFTYVSIARGADSLLYFRWRTCRSGAEEYWCGILDHDNVPRRRYAEVKQIGAELRELGPQLRGTHVHVDTAIASADHEVEDAHSTLPFGLPSPQAVAAKIHEAFWRRNYAVGFIHPTDDLAGVKLYVIPHWATFDPGWVPALEKFVRGGGTLVIGARTATRDMHNNVVAETIPGCLRDLAGVTVAEYSRINLPKQRPRHLVLAGKKMLAEHWCEILEPAAGTTTLAKWSGRHLTGTAAVTVRQLGQGRVVYVGTYLTEALVPALVKLSGLKPLWPVPAGVEVVRRQDARKQLWFFINHNDRPAKFKSPAGKPVTLQPNDVLIHATKL